MRSSGLTCSLLATAAAAAALDINVFRRSAVTPKASAAGTIITETTESRTTFKAASTGSSKGGATACPPVPASWEASVVVSKVGTKRAEAHLFTSTTGAYCASASGLKSTAFASVVADRAVSTCASWAVAHSDATTLFDTQVFFNASTNQWGCVLWPDEKGSLESHAWSAHSNHIDCSYSYHAVSLVLHEPVAGSSTTSKSVAASVKSQTLDVKVAGTTTKSTASTTNPATSTTKSTTSSTKSTTKSTSTTLKSSAKSTTTTTKTTPKTTTTTAKSSTKTTTTTAKTTTRTTTTTITITSRITSKTTLSAAGTTTVASSAPTMPSTRTASGLNVVYWGQNGGNTIENNDLSTYCTSTAGIDVVVLAFLYEYGNGNKIASGVIGQSCYISPQGVPQQCDALAAAIGTCQAAGIKVMLSLGGAVGAYSLSSQAEAETIGQNLWDAYSKVGSGSVPRPFGTNFVNGWDFDIEASSGNQYYQYLIAKLRSNFASDPSETYYITAAPQCPIPEPNMGEIISASTFDYLWIQFYNNPGCSVNGQINFDQWVSFVAGTPSAGAKIFIGVPAAPDGATGTASGAQYYLAPAQLATLVAEYDTNTAFGGVMMWSAGFSDSNVINGCTYAQQAYSILGTGSPCGSGTSSIHTGTTVSSSSPKSSSPTLKTSSSTLQTKSASITSRSGSTSVAAAVVAAVADTTTQDAADATSGTQSGNCSPEGYWNCVDGTQYQRCANGAWTQLQPVAPGTACVPGESSNLQVEFA